MKPPNQSLREIAAQFAKSGLRVRLTDAEADAYFENMMDSGAAEGIRVDLGGIIAVSRKWFASYNEVTQSTVSRWVNHVEGGLPVLPDGMVPLDLASDWVDRNHERIRILRSYGRTG